MGLPKSKPTLPNASRQPRPSRTPSRRHHRQIPLTIDPTFGLQTTLVAPNPANKDGLGSSIAVSADGNTAIAGVQSRGVAVVFVRNGATWTVQQILVAPDGVSGDGFGFSVAMSGDGNTVAIGAFGFGAGLEGAVFVFTRTGNTWIQQQNIPSPFRAAPRGGDHISSLDD